MHRRSVLGAGLALGASRAVAQPVWPDRPVVLVDGYPPGGVTDLASRAVAAVMARELGVPVVVENRPGAATSVAATYASRARPDGHTLVMGTSTLAINHTLQPSLTPRDPVKELDPIGMVFRTPFILQVHPAIPAADTAAFIAHCRRTPGSVLFGSPGTGSVSHLCLEMFRVRTGIDIVHVPYRGGTDAALGLRKGEVHAVFQAPQEARAMLRDGSSHGLAVTAAAPLAAYPGIPSILGDLPDLEVFFWQGLFAPPGVPPAIRARTAAALRAATADPATRRRLADADVELVTDGAERLGAVLAADIERWREVIRKGNITLD
jgi:tripartite-type tricarboxylate transporter receptor subunit TctC